MVVELFKSYDQRGLIMGTYEVQVDITLHNQTKRIGIKPKTNRSNIAFKSLKTALTFSLESEGEQSHFRPVCWGIINDVMIGHIGMIRFFNGALEFSYYEAARSDCDVFKLFINLGKSWELAAVESVNSFISSNGYCKDRNMIRVKVRHNDLRSAHLKLCRLLRQGIK